MRLVILAPGFGVAAIIACGLATLIMFDLIWAHIYGTRLGRRPVLLSALILAVVFVALLASEAGAFPMSCGNLCEYIPGWLCSILYPGC